MDQKLTPNGLSREQKTGFVLLFVFGFLAVGLGFLQMRNTIYLPFVTRASDEDSGTVEMLFDEDMRLQQIDTDQDGLNDYEELYFFSTSPYLPDTDSDGIDDKTELDQGTDPLCPEGQQCEEEATLPNDTAVIDTFLDTEALSPLDMLAGTSTLPQTGTGSDLGFDVEAIAKDPVAVRELLKNMGGVSEEMLAGIPDETLLELVGQILEEQGVGLTDN